MRTTQEIRLHLEHFQNGQCHGEKIVVKTWIAALEWVLQPRTAEAEFSSAFGELVFAAHGAIHALRSYEYGNSATDLAKEVADHLSDAVIRAFDERDSQLDDMSTTLTKVNELLAGLQQDIRSNSAPDAKPSV